LACVGRRGEGIREFAQGDLGGRKASYFSVNLKVLGTQAVFRGITRPGGRTDKSSVSGWTTKDVLSPIRISPKMAVSTQDDGPGSVRQGCARCARRRVVRKEASDGW